MRFIHSLTNLAQDSDCFVDFHRPPCFQPFGERSTFEVFHYQVGQGLVACAADAEIGNVDYVRMSKQADRLRLSSEPFDEFTIAGKFRGNDFDGYATACAYVSRAINRAHSAS